MTKLKCWKKIGKKGYTTKYVTKDHTQLVSVSVFPKSLGNDGYFSHGVSSSGSGKEFSIKEQKEFKNGKKAFQFAKSFMKKYNQC